MSEGRAPGRRLGDGAVGAPRLLTPKLRHVECSLLMRSRPQVVRLVVAGTDRFRCMREQTVNFTNHLRRSILAAVATTVVVGVAGTAHADITPKTAPVTVSAAPATTPVQAPTATGALVAAVTAPSTPRSPTATPGNARVKLAWQRPASNGGASINRYRVQRARAGGPWKTIAKPTVRRYRAAGLTNGTRYYFRVAAHNAAGWSTPSKVVKAVPRMVPTAPRSPTATPGNATVKLTWRRPSSNGGATINKYAVQRAVAGGAWKTIAYPTTRSHTTNGLTNGEKYSFRIRAHNTAGWGPYSSVVNTVPGAVPTAPPYPVMQSGDGKITVSWLAPSGYVGPAVDKYAVQQSLTGISGWTTIAYPTTRNYTAGGLTNGTKYYFRIRAHNAVGWGLYSPVVNTVPGTVPTAPQNPTLQPGDGKITVSWLAPSGYVGAPVTYYVVERAPNPGGPWTEASFPSCCSQEVSQLTNGTLYYFRVAAYNAAGWGPYSTVLSAIPVGVPGAPRNLTATVANSKVTLKWIAPLSDGGKPVDRYDIYSADSANGPETFAGTTQLNEYVFNGSLGKTYYFTVYSHNTLGNGPASTVSATIPATVPSAPTACGGVQLGGDGSQTLRATWGPPSSDGGKPILFYEVQRLAGNPPTTVEKTIYVWDLAATTYDFTQVDFYSWYTIEVRAYNAVGPGPGCFSNYVSMDP